MFLLISVLVLDKGSPIYRVLGNERSLIEFVGNKTYFL